uniref:Expressed protein n=2 Tax=Schizophyllum commune (strain H4-8 / FGSC 9210) TaxID=578458 RepID=D8PZP9_SCHCM
MDPETDALCADTKRGSMHSVQSSPISPQDDIWSDNDLEVLTVVAEAGQPRLGASSAGLKAGGQELGWKADLAGDMLHLTDDVLEDLSDDAPFHEKDDESDREQGRWRLGGETAGSLDVLWKAGVFSHDEGLLSDSDDDLR